MSPTSGGGPARTRTKIVATLGPACRGEAPVRELAEAGADVFRLNFSHGSEDEHAGALRDVRAAAGTLDRPLAVLQDLAGPKLRLGDVPGGEVLVAEGEDLALVSDAGATGPRAFELSHPELLVEFAVGGRVVLGDGDVAARVVATSAARATLEVEHGGRVRSRQGLHAPVEARGLPCLTDRDLLALDWSARMGESGPDFIALSFVRGPEDIVRLRAELEARGLAPHVVAKIEKSRAVDRLDEILAVSDAVMVARGDLGLETDIARVPALQKQILAAAQTAGRPAITATQMLASMERAPTPTRAEASDVFNAVLDGSDALMLSGETAVGAHPALVVATMERILGEAERVSMPRALAAVAASGVSDVTRALVSAAQTAAADVGAALVLVATESGRTALAVSRLRVPTLVVAVALRPAVARRMAAWRGIVPRHGDGTLEQALDRGLAWAREAGLVRSGDRVVLLQGASAASAIHDVMAIRVIE